MINIILLCVGASLGCSTLVLLLALCRARHLPPIRTVNLRGELVDIRT